MSLGNMSSAVTVSAEIAERFGETYDPEVVQDIAFFVLGSATPEIHPMDVMIAGLPFVTEDLYPPNRARAVSDAMLSDSDLCRAIVTAKQQF